MIAFDRYASRMPTTMLIWNSPTSRPRHFAGASSAIYTGPSTDEPPIPSPPRNRNARKLHHGPASAQPAADNT